MGSCGKLREEEAQRDVTLFEILKANAAVYVRIASRSASILRLANNGVCYIVAAAGGWVTLKFLVDKIHDWVVLLRRISAIW